MVKERICVRTVLCCKAQKELQILQTDNLLCHGTRKRKRRTFTIVEFGFFQK